MVIFALVSVFWGSAIAADLEASRVQLDEFDGEWSWILASHEVCVDFTLPGSEADFYGEATLYSARERDDLELIISDYIESTVIERDDEYAAKDEYSGVGVTATTTLWEYDPDEELLWGVTIASDEDDSRSSCSRSAYRYVRRTYRSSGSYFYIYPRSDMITATTGPARNSNADPDVYLWVWNGSRYVFRYQSISTHGLDTVYDSNGSCNRRRWRIKINPYRGGYIGYTVILFNAN